MRYVISVEEINNEKYKSLPKGSYLFIRDKDGNEISLNKDIVDKAYKAGKNTESGSSSTDVVVGKDPLAKQEFDQSISRPVFNELVSLIKESLGQSSLSLDDSVEYYEIFSDQFVLLQYPWESIFDKDVVRLISTNHVRTNEDKINSILLLLSHSHTDVKDKIIDNLKREANEIHVNVLEDKFFTKISLIKHTNRSLLIDHSTFLSQNDHLHFLMHGDDDGNLWLEGLGNAYKTPDKINIDSFLKLIPDKCFKLLFFSVCYTAGGLSGDDPSVAYRVVKEGYSQYSIGYFHGANNKASVSFGAEFYKGLVSGLGVSKSFFRARNYAGVDFRNQFLYASSSVNLQNEAN